ncbi:hypothetical protein H5410_006396 [Solanum commersonii]|uniref:Uncharacterized protein n=1 Tax=Solanum commersonii TaxID=4109 RepID=A0A9J6AAB7_SOLCO|nr:hypothetical protein H5410_006396 [Solanum commersonii]
MKKESTIVFTLLWAFILLGSQSCVVLGKDQKCQRAQDCAPSCQLGIPTCSDGICGCIGGIRSVYFKKDNISLQDENSLSTLMLNVKLHGRFYSE